MSNDLINQARELCERIDDADQMQSTYISTIHDLCDALEAAERKIEQFTAENKVREEMIAGYQNTICPEYRAKIKEFGEKIIALTARAEKAESQCDKAAEFIKWVDTDFGYTMPSIYVDRLMALEIAYWREKKDE